MKLRYVYLVSYIYRQGVESGTGSIVMYRQSKINCEAEVNSVTEYIKQKYNNEDKWIILLGFLSLKDSTVFSLLYSINPHSIHPNSAEVMSIIFVHKQGN